jgi:ceramide glucosyltransferase
MFPSRQRYRPQRQSFSWRPLLQVPGVSILRPLKGLDANLYENLESTFKQDYPNFEILFSVADEQDDALPIVRELITRYPNVNAEIIIGNKNGFLLPSFRCLFFFCQVNNLLA